MRRLLCASCGGVSGRRKVFEESSLGEPAEWKRTVVGQARTPTPAQRIIKVNNTPIPLRLTEFDCDGCNAAIKPGDSACAETIWRDDQQEPPPWEAEYLA